MHKMKSRLYRTMFSVAVCILTGCGAPSHLVFFQSTVLGVDVATSSQGGTVHATLGYDRQTVAFVPKTQTTETQDQTQQSNEAMSVIAKTNIDVRWLGVQQIYERFATGQAAINIANNPEAIQKLEKP